jgi:preprotein translocase subunit SecA
MSIRNKFFSNTIESAQRRVEGNNFDTRKTVLEYDDVINQQREIIYERRNAILDSESIHERILEAFGNYAKGIVNSHLATEGKLSTTDINEIIEVLNETLQFKNITSAELENKTSEQVITYLYEAISSSYNEKMSQIPVEMMNDFEKAIALRVVDMHWMDHINTMSLLMEGIRLRSYGQDNPLRAYTSEGFELFENLLNTIDREVTIYLLRAEVRQNTERKQVAKGEAVTDVNKVKKQTPKKVNKIGRNDLCPCGSGKKYKQCCGK